MHTELRFWTIRHRVKQTLYLAFPQERVSERRLTELARQFGSLVFGDASLAQVALEPSGQINQVYFHPDLVVDGLSEVISYLVDSDEPDFTLDIVTVFHYFKDPETALAMSRYLRDQFPFLGLNAPLRKRLSRLFLKSRSKSELDWDFVMYLWEKPEREFQYLAQAYLEKQQKNLSAKDLVKLSQLIRQKSWWDTVDGLDQLVGNLTLRFPHLNQTMLEWSVSDNIWLRRVAINHQLGQKAKTSRELLGQIIENNLGQAEFFINKAIGWALRDYSKTNAAWVRAFIMAHEADMANLSVREASKYL